jgi:intracellular sulfur oxidation DsrE/DsrF family protein
MSNSEKPLHIDIPVKLAEVKVAFSVPALAFEGDLPASIFHIQLIENDIADWRAKAQVIAVFHTNAGHVTLNDKAYNTERNVATGNPYKDLVSDLMKRGVHFELCGATAKIHNWGNEDVLPGIKINTDAMRPRLRNSRSLRAISSWAKVAFSERRERRHHGDTDAIGSNTRIGHENAEPCVTPI